jgi:nucleotide-binding universal stress UspA family protein
MICYCKPLKFHAERVRPQFLSLRQDTAEGIPADPPADSVGADLLSTAERTGAGLIVMGAYTHGRMRQIVFDGVTSHIVQNAGLPVLMAH